MRAAVLHEYGVPGVDEFEEPSAGPEQALVDVLAAGVNPVDTAICAGRFYAGKPPLPSVAGREGVGLLDGSRVYFDAPIAPFGSMAERALINPASTYAVPDGVSDGVAVALGISGLAAWLALTWRARLKQGEHVLVLAASGVVGQIAVQAAKLLGAGRVVAAARSREGLERCLELGADAAVRFGEPADLPAALTDAADGRIDVVVDPLWGEPLVAAVNAASFGARIVQLGAGADADAMIPSAAIRGKMLVLMGHTNFAAPPEVKREAYRRLARAATADEIRVEVDTLALEQVDEAWRRLAAGSHRKIVLVP
ncbi:MAG TPA: zinc-binding dehydrogenase [Solirubrobacteraceae bacterium]|jgi:NADPH:quinone reductase-like Zn-dependent oxidoreductase|nr:zinc-binding dehydrogenase [Solirubrobacteraceae bacterium]